MRGQDRDPDLLAEAIAPPECASGRFKRSLDLVHGLELDLPDPLLAHAVAFGKGFERLRVVQQPSGAEDVALAIIHGSEDVVQPPDVAVLLGGIDDDLLG